MDDYELSPSRREARARMLRRRRITLSVAAGALVVLLGGGTAWAVGSSMARSGAPAEARETPTPKPSSSPSPSPSPSPEVSPQPEPEAPAYDLDDPNSITVVVNKQRTLTPIDYAPSDLVDTGSIPNVWGHSIRAEANDALQLMYADAVAAGAAFTITSGYREYALQKDIYDGLVAEGGVEYADRDTARPGHSEHQTGLAVDLFSTEEGCSLARCFEDTVSGIWLRENSWRYGYILRYDDGAQDVVGYTYEPWHFRYVGVDVATAMHEQGVRNLEDFFGLPPAPTN